MAKRRPDGDGLVRKRGDGRWEGRIVVGHKEDGKPIYRSVFAKTQKELMDKLHDNLEAYRDVELTTGMRRGEICGLRWTDFDERTGMLRIRRSVTSRKGGGVQVGETKTETGARSILLPPSTAELLKARKKKSYSEWIFCNPTVPELPLSPATAYRRMKTLLRYAELPSIRFHDLRHTFATHALSCGVDAKTLSGILGHTNASFTLDTYTHVTTDMQKKASGIVGNFLDEIM